MRLFIDCDDTLILWGENPNGLMWRGDMYTVNQKLIDALKKFIEAEKPSSVIVWSGGGRQYAQHWADRYFPDNDFVLSKDITLPTVEDICVDDMQLSVASVVFTPDAFIEYVEKGLFLHKLWWE